jgi:lipopolysaccharide/colanic/teichoic acid biosynthesis glycosyltransferase
MEESAFVMMTTALEDQRDVLQPAAARPGERYLAATVMANRILASILLIPCLPAMGLLWAIVRLTSPGPAIFQQRRVGIGGVVFTLYKIRTMRIDAESKTGAVWAQTNDPRVTPVGRLLRALHLDELPQLFNVIAGDMVLIGPRPERPEFTQQLARALPTYLDRLCVRPGITGLAQINLPADTDLESVRRKLIVDLEYISEASFSLDVRIVLATCLRLVGVRRATSCRWLGVTCRLLQDEAAEAAVIPLTPATIAMTPAALPVREATRAVPQVVRAAA